MLIVQGAAMCVVEPTAGQVCLEEEDFSLEGDTPFFFTRRYSNSSTHAGSLGTGWLHKHEVHLDARGPKLSLIDEEARGVPLAHLRPGETFRNLPDGLLLERTEHEYRLHARGGQTLVFSATASPAGRLPLLRRDKTDENTVWYEYDDGGRLAELRTSSQHVLRFAYDPQGRVREIRRLSPLPGQRLVSYAYDDLGYLTHAYDAEDRPTAYEYDGGLLTRYTNRAGGSYYLEYDDRRRCVTIWQDGLTRFRSYRYDDERHMTLVTDSSGRSTLLRYNELSLLQEIVRPDGTRVQYAYGEGNRPLAVLGPGRSPPVRKYDEFQNVVEEIGSNGGKAAWAYDARGRVVKKVRPDGGISEWDYDDNNRITRHRGPTGAVTTLAFDAGGRLATRTTPLGNRVRATRTPEGGLRLEDDLGPLRSSWHDTISNTLHLQSPAGDVVRVQYDRFDRIIAMTAGDGRRAERAYDALGSLVRSTDYAGNETRYERDPFGLLLKWVMPSGRTVLYEHDDERRLVACRTSTGAATRFEYDARGRLVRQALRDGRVRTVVYDENGRRSAVLDSGGIHTHYTYTPTGFMAEIRSGGAGAAYDYDVSGNCTVAETDGHRVERVFGPGGLLLSETQGDFVVEYTYNPVGLVTERRDSSGRVARYRYNVRGQLTEVEDTACGTHRFEFDAFGRKTRHVLPNGVRRQYSYDRAGNVTRVVTLAPGGDVLQDRHYSYDASGELARAAERDEAVTFAYDAERQLLAVGGSGAQEVFRYDLDGNVVQTAEVGSLRYDGLHLRSAGRLRYDYDPAGRVTSRDEGGRAVKLTYGLGGLVRTATFPDGRVFEYEYDGFGRRISKRGPDLTVRYFWDKDVLLREERTTPEGSVIIVYAFVPGTFRPLGHGIGGRLFHYDWDQRSLVREVYDGSGVEVARYRYRAFGERVTLSQSSPEADCPFRLQGQIFDAETDLHCNRFRYYDPRVGRFLSPDPYVHRVEHNPYTYAPNPIGWADPFGLMAAFSKKDKDAWLEENKNDNGGYYTCANCGFQSKNKTFAKTAETGRPVGDGSFHVDHKDVPNCDDGPATKDNHQILGGTCNCSKGAGEEAALT